MWNLKKLSSERLVIEWWLPESGGRGKEEMLVKGYKLPVRRGLSSQDNNSMVIRVNNTVSYT